VMDGCERFLRNVDEDSLYCPIPQSGHKHWEPALQVNSTSIPDYWKRKRKKKKVSRHIYKDNVSLMGREGKGC